MKNINEYISQKKWSIHSSARSEYFFKHIKDFYNNIVEDIPEKYIEEYKNFSLCTYEYLDENLQSHDWKLLQKKLLEEYWDEIDGFETYYDNDKTSSFSIILKEITRLNFKLRQEAIESKDPSLDKFFNLLEFFNYKYSCCQNNKEGRITYIIEPIFSKRLDRNNKTYYHDQAYNFTLKKNVPFILKNGLKIKCSTEENKKYREFPRRIYLYMAYERINQLDQKELHDFLTKIFGDNIKLKDIGIIKVDLHGSDYPIYKDTCMTFERAVFVYNNIPPSWLKEIKVEL